MNTSQNKNLILSCLSFCVALWAPWAHADSLILNGGFEDPTTGPGGLNSGYTLYTTGQTIGNAWTVVGSTGGNVATTPSTEYSIGLGNVPVFFTAQEGAQSLDLTGNTDNGSVLGVQQTIATLPGHDYALSFYLGAVTTTDWAPHQGTAVINVLLNGNAFQTAINNTPSADSIDWKRFDYTFTAAGDTTTLAFMNAVPFPVGENGLDNVVVTDVTVPEPGVCGLFALGLGFIMARRRQLGRSLN